MNALRRKNQKPLIVNIRAIHAPIQPSPGFAKKGLSEFKLDVMGLCQYGCRYCSSNSGNYLRINRKRFADRTKKQLGKRIYPANEPALTFQWPDVLERLQNQLARKPADWGQGQTLVYSMLTDGFSPIVVSQSVTEKALRLVLEKTSFRIRVLTKNAVVGQDHWIRFFLDHPGRFVVGLSIGTLDDRWARQVETFTALPTGRLEALRRLQDAGVPTYGMLCPIFPDVLEAGRLEELVDRVRPQLVEDLWAEPFNDRQNWQHVRAGYAADSTGFNWLTDVYGERRLDRWSQYATELYQRLRQKARAEGWIAKLKYLLYEGNITERDSVIFRRFEGVLLQSAKGADGRSSNPHLARFQQA